MFDHSRKSVLFALDEARRCVIEGGLTEDDARTSLDVVLCRMPVDPFAPGALSNYFADLDAEMRDLSAAERNRRLANLFGVDGVRAAVLLCRRFALTPEAVSA